MEKEKIDGQYPGLRLLPTEKVGSGFHGQGEGGGKVTHPMGHIVGREIGGGPTYPQQEHRRKRRAEEGKIFRAGTRRARNGVENRLNKNPSRQPEIIFENGKKI